MLPRNGGREKHPWRSLGQWGDEWLAKNKVEKVKRGRIVAARAPKTIVLELCRYVEHRAGFRKGLPIEHVAKLRSTSVKMIERHYTNTLRALKTSQGRRTCPWCRGGMEYLAEVLDLADGTGQHRRADTASGCEVSPGSRSNLRWSAPSESAFGGGSSDTVAGEQRDQAQPSPRSRRLHAHSLQSRS